MDLALREFRGHRDLAGTGSFAPALPFAATEAGTVVELASRAGHDPRWVA